MKEFKEKEIVKICTIISMLGLLLLFFYTESYDLKTVVNLETNDFNEVVKIQGEIGDISQHEKLAFVEIENQKIETTKVIIFKDEDLWLKKGDYVTITGTVEEYEGEKEIITSKVVVKGR